MNDQQHDGGKAANGGCKPGEQGRSVPEPPRRGWARHWAEDALGGVGAARFAMVMDSLFLPHSFLIPSTSGLATVSMPMMARLTA